MQLRSLPVQLGLLASLQALVLINNIVMIVVTGLAAMSFGVDKLLVTLPVSGYVLGGALWSMPAANLMRKYGRRAGYTLASCIAILGAAMAYFSVTHKSFTLFCLSTLVCGAYQAFGHSYRFAAVDAAETYNPSFKARAISLVLAGGIVGGIIGPEAAKFTRGLFEVQFAGTYLSLIGFAATALLLAQALRLPKPPAAGTGAAAVAPRPLSAILAQPACIVAIASAAMAYGMMNLLMVATPMAMDVCGHPFAAAAFVIQGHVIAMYAPGFITGSLIDRYGPVKIILGGTVLMLACTGVALSGVDIFAFAVSSALLGIGWNLMYTGGTALLTRCYQPQEKNKVQGFMDFCVLSTMVTTSASSGALLFSNGWQVLNWAVMGVALAAMALSAWGLRSTASPAPAAS